MSEIHSISIYFYCFTNQTQVRVNHQPFLRFMATEKQFYNDVIPRERFRLPRTQLLAITFGGGGGGNHSPLALYTRSHHPLACVGCVRKGMGRELGREATREGGRRREEGGGVPFLSSSRAQIPPSPSLPLSTPATQINHPPLALLACLQHSRVVSRCSPLSVGKACGGAEVL